MTQLAVEGLDASLSKETEHSNVAPCLHNVFLLCDWRFLNILIYAVNRTSTLLSVHKFQLTLL